MTSKAGGTQGYRYLMSLLSGLCRGPIDEMCEISVGDKQAWNGHVCSDARQQIEAGNLFGGDEKEGGIEGPFRVFMGAENQVLPAGGDNPVDNPRASIGGLVSQMRGVVTVMFDGMVSAMNPYLKTWKFRVRRSKLGWHGGQAWYRDKATVYLGGSVITASSNRANDLPVNYVADDDRYTITFTRNAQEGDSITVNGFTINFVADTKDSKLGEGEIDPDNKSTEKTIRKVVNYINSRATQFKAIASQDGTVLSLVANKALQDIYAMNASHIVYECYTNPLWGRGFPTTKLDDNAFTLAANQLCNEGFGIALIWYRKEDIDVFIQKIVDLAGGITYTDRETGLLVFKLIRNDYDINTIPHYTPETGLLDITSDDSTSADNSYNEIIGTSRDPITNQDFQVRAQNPAALISQGAPSSLDKDYKGIPTKALLQRVVLRDLRAMASGLKKYDIALDRRAWRITPGSVIRISHPARGLSNVVLRVGDIDDGDMVNGRIKIKAALDVFGLPATSYQEEVRSSWIAPNGIAVPALDERLIEAGYRDIYLTRGSAEAQALDPTSAYIGQLATAPNTTSLEYDLLTRADGEAFSNRGRGPFTGNARLSAAIGPLDTAVMLDTLSMFDGDNVGQAVLLGDELVRLDAVNTATGAATITRGVGDTIPQAHDAGDVLWTIDDDLVPDGVAYVRGETAYSKVLTRTSSQILSEDDADEQEVDLVSRHARPYPPADVKIGGVSIFTKRKPNAAVVLTWAERNRIVQGDKLIGYTEPSVAGEIGQTYTIRVYKKDGTLVRTVEGIADTTWEYTAAMQLEDNPGNRVVVELESARDGLSSWQHYTLPIALKGGWGYSWGSGWGG